LWPISAARPCPGGPDQAGRPRPADLRHQRRRRLDQLDPGHGRPVDAGRLAFANEHAG